MTSKPTKSVFNCGAAEAEFTPPPGLTLLGQMHERIATHKRDPLTANAIACRQGRETVVLVSVDPAHDTPAALAAYLPHFDPAFAGATGDAAALAPLARALGAYVAPATGEAGGRVVHSGAVYLIDPAARIAAVYTTLPAPLALAADYRRVLRARGGA